MLFPFPLELFPLVAQNYSHSHGNPMETPWEWKFPFPCTPLAIASNDDWCNFARTLHALLASLEGTFVWLRLRQVVNICCYAPCIHFLTYLLTYLLSYSGHLPIEERKHAARRDHSVTWPHAYSLPTPSWLCDDIQVYQNAAPHVSSY